MFLHWFSQFSETLDETILPEDIPLFGVWVKKMKPSYNPDPNLP